jgi:UDP-GlcNAc:undecaprenyl-phosphate GlcNAc-1-phosphate transferase
MEGFQAQAWSAAAWAAAAALGVALLVAWILLATQRWHFHWTQDHPDHGDHKLHAEPTMRIGGLVIVMGMLAGWGLFSAAGLMDRESAGLLRMVPLSLAALLLLGFGLLEDVTRNVSVRMRLVVAGGAALLAWTWADVRVTHTELDLFDHLLLQSAWVSLAFTVFAITGLVHAMNIIDGLNGLLAGTSILVFACTGFVAATAQAWDLLGLSLVAAAATLGFALFNFPRARMFCGDSGAYLLGFVAAVLLVILMQHRITSPWFGLALVVHPVTETLYSSWRRYRNGQSPTTPDTMHLHSLIHLRMRMNDKCGQCANARASMLTLLMTAWPMAVCVIFPTEAVVLQCLIVVYVVAYAALHSALVRQMQAWSGQLSAADWTKVGS